MVSNVPPRIVDIADAERDVDVDNDDDGDGIENDGEANDDSLGMIVLCILLLLSMVRP